MAAVLAPDQLRRLALMVARDWCALAGRSPDRGGFPTPYAWLPYLVAARIDCGYTPVQVRHSSFWASTAEILEVCGHPDRRRPADRRLLADHAELAGRYRRALELAAARLPHGDPGRFGNYSVLVRRLLRQQTFGLEPGLPDRAGDPAYAELLAARWQILLALLAELEAGFAGAGPASPGG